MKIISSKLKGAAIIESDILQDSRGNFSRLFCQNDLKDLHNYQSIDQINYSFTLKRGTIRGLHFQKPPFMEIKLIRCIKGKIFDVIVDLRKDSITFLKWHGEILSEDNFRMHYIPKGFAHGFQTLEDNCELIYLHNGFYNPKSENGFVYNDKILSINWPLPLCNLSFRDLNLSKLDSNFKGFEI